MTGALGSGLPNFGEEYNKIRLRVIGRLIEERRHARTDLVVHPVVGSPVTKNERRMTYLKLTTSGVALKRALDEQGERWKLDPNIVASNVYDFLKDEHKALRKEQES